MRFICFCRGSRLFFYFNRCRLVFRLFVVAVWTRSAVSALTVSAISLATTLRSMGVRTQLYTEKKKFKAKIGYADKLGIPFALFLGEDEINNGVVAVKDMKSGEQTTAPLSEQIPAILEAIRALSAQTVIKTAETNA